MIVKIWRVLAQILFDREDLIETIKPFFDNLKKENINDEKYIPFLKTFSKYQLEILYQNEIITKERLNSTILIGFRDQTFDLNSNDISIETLISGDNVEELRLLIQKRNIKTISTVIRSFKEVKKMEIPLIQYCIMKKAIECFKYLLVNGYDDPNKTMKEQNSDYFYSNNNKIKRYEWDCMTTAIYYGNNEIINILENRGIEKGNNQSHIEAAILSYRNIIAKDIIEKLIEENPLNILIISSAKSNNLIGAELLIRKGININAKDIIILN